MTIHDPRMAPRRDGGGMCAPGGATVSDLRMMDGERALAVMMFRDSFVGPDGTERVRGLFAEALGSEAGTTAFSDWSAFLKGLVRHARRPLMRHALTCTCVGADEAVIAEILYRCARGEREDAMLVLALIVPGDRLPLLMAEAERIGGSIMQVAQHYRKTMSATASCHLH